MIKPKQIVALRKRLGLNQVDFASKLGVDRSTVWRWETDRVEIPWAVQIVLRQMIEQAA